MAPGMPAVPLKLVEKKWAGEFADFGELPGCFSYSLGTRLKDTQRPTGKDVSNTWSTQGDKGGMHNCANSTSVASTGVVPHPAGVPDRVPSLTTKASAVVDRPLQPVTSALREGTTAVGRMEGIRQRHTAAGISNRASRLILAGWSKATNTAYQSSWERWNRWCVKREIDPFSCDWTS